MGLDRTGRTAPSGFCAREAGSRRNDAGPNSNPLDSQRQFSPTLRHVTWNEQTGRVTRAFERWKATDTDIRAYLERNDGKRVFIEEYTPPGSDGFGARFIFPRTLDGKPFLTPEHTLVRFVSELDSQIKLRMDYKVSEMMLDGKLEY